MPRERRKRQVEMSEYIDVKIDVFESADQRARVLETLTPAGLIQEILKEFDDITADTPEKYAIYLKGMERPLSPGSTMAQLDIQPQDELVFDYVRQTIRQMLEPKDYAFLHEVTTRKDYDIQWQPAVIGRPDSDVGHNIILAVNVQLLPNGRSVSRKHAQITFSEGRYFIEPLAEHNPVFLNGKEIPLNSKREIKNNDKIAIGRHKITMVFETQRAGSPSIAELQSADATMMPSMSAVQAPVAQAVKVPIGREAAGSSSGKPPVTFLVVEKCSTTENVGQKLTLVEYPFLLGRTLPLLSAEKEISRRHAEISYDAQNKKFTITDLNSSNGVTVDGIRIRSGDPTEIKAGTRLGLGNVLGLRFEG
jgi:pSer/pThr/pTyr-binding forkhead associated (FHA) protein